MSEVSIEKCLNRVPNKFDLTVFIMNRAKEILLNAKTDVPDSKYTKKSIKKSIREIENNMIDIDLLKKRIEENLISNNTFLKDDNKDDNLDVNDSNTTIDDNNDIDDEDYGDDGVEEMEDDMDLDGVDMDSIEDEN